MQPQRRLATRCAKKSPPDRCNRMACDSSCARNLLWIQCLWAAVTRQRGMACDSRDDLTKAGFQADLDAPSLPRGAPQPDKTMMYNPGAWANPMRTYFTVMPISAPVTSGSLWSVAFSD
jgi:hypothetical protein